jgi:hypothetical protein
MQRRRNRELERQGQIPAREPGEPPEAPQNDDIVISDGDYEGHYFTAEPPGDNDASESKQTREGVEQSGVRDSEEKLDDAVIRSLFSEYQIDSGESSDIPQCPPSPRLRPVVAQNRDEANSRKPKPIQVERKIDKPRGGATNNSGGI